MCRTLRWQIANGYGGTDVLARLEPLLTRYGLPTAIDCDEAALRRCVGHDKKNRRRYGAVGHRPLYGTG